ncbi:MAG TPA: BamA/TamA family outer membrane protein, partial [Gemmatimonadales bacterium]|nr:BamA/TamA family outer membrane protein [Gemmatimonadales bacterium]
VDYLGEWHDENSRIGWTLGAAASGIEVLRFYGLGNETSSAGGDNEYYRITQQQYGIAPAVLLPVGRRGELQLGPVLKYASTDDHPDRFLATVNPYGAGKFGEIGLRMRYRLDGRNRANAATTGGLLELGGAIYPPWWDVKETFGEVHGEASAYLTPKGFPLSPTLSLRVGGKQVWGAYPFFEAAFIGSVNTVRLGEQDRYAGDASAYGSTELRLPLFHATLVLPADFGIFGLADAGRVFVDGEHSDQWHSAFGGGIWIAFVGPANAISAAIASSREHNAKLYVRAGFGI